MRALGALPQGFWTHGARVVTDCVLHQDDNLDLDNGALGPKYHNLNGLEDLKLQYLGPWTFWVSVALVNRRFSAMKEWILIAS